MAHRFRIGTRKSTMALAQTDPAQDLAKWAVVGNELASEAVPGVLLVHPSSPIRTYARPRAPRCFAHSQNRDRAVAAEVDIVEVRLEESGRQQLRVGDVVEIGALLVEREPRPGVDVDPEDLAQQRTGTLRLVLRIAAGSAAGGGSVAHRARSLST